MLTEEEKKRRAREAHKKWLAKNPDYYKQWNAKNKEARAASTKRYRENNRDKYLENARAAYHRRNKDHVKMVMRKNKLRKNYGLSLEDFDKLFASQGMRCAICGADDPTHTNWVVDHHHKTGKVRGILCSPCNIALRKDRDTVDHLHKALNYILAFEKTLTPQE